MEKIRLRQELSLKDCTSMKTFNFPAVTPQGPGEGAAGNKEEDSGCRALGFLGCITDGDRMWTCSMDDGFGLCVRL